MQGGLSISLDDLTHKTTHKIRASDIAEVAAALHTSDALSIADSHNATRIITRVGNKTLVMARGKGDRTSPNQIASEARDVRYSRDIAEALASSQRASVRGRADEAADILRACHIARDGAVGDACSIYFANETTQLIAAATHFANDSTVLEGRRTGIATETAT